MKEEKEKSVKAGEVDKSMLTADQKPEASLPSPVTPTTDSAAASTRAMDKTEP